MLGCCRAGCCDPFAVAHCGRRSRNDEGCTGGREHGLSFGKGSHLGALLLSLNIHGLGATSMHSTSLQQFWLGRSRPARCYVIGGAIQHFVEE